MRCRYRTLANLLVAVGIESSGALHGLVDACPRPGRAAAGGRADDVIGDMSDHHAFRLRSVPYLFLTCGRWAHYHQETDMPDRLAWAKMALIRDYVVSLAGAMAIGLQALGCNGQRATPAIAASANRGELVCLPIEGPSRSAP